MYPKKTLFHCSESPQISYGLHMNQGQEEPGTGKMKREISNIKLVGLLCPKHTTNEKPKTLSELVSASTSVKISFKQISLCHKL
jgi:hypothetical protein